MTFSLSANTIPIKINIGGTVPFPPFNLPNTLTLYDDGISTGRRRLGMLVYVHETQTTYQYTIPNYDTLWDNAVSDGDVIFRDYTIDVEGANSNSIAFINAWTGSTIEGVNGVTRNNARWRIFWGTDWQVTGGTISYNDKGTLSLTSNSGNTVNIEGF